MRAHRIRRLTAATLSAVLAAALGLSLAAQPSGAAPRRGAAQTTGATASPTSATVHAAPVAATGVRTLRFTLFFPSGSATMTIATRHSAAAIPARVPAGATDVRTVITGYVQLSSNHANDVALARARARAVNARLHAAKLPGTVSLRVGGVAGPGPAARRALVVITYRASRAQTLTFTPPADMAVTDPDQPLSASASSRLPVTLRSSTPSVCTVVARAAHAVTTGTCTIVASQAGTAYVRAARSVARTLRISRAAQDIFLKTPADMVVGSSDQVLNTSASSGLPVVVGTTTPDVCTIVDGALHAVAAGTCELTVDQPGDATYAPAAQVVAQVTVSAAPLLGNYTVDYVTGVVGYHIESDTFLRDYPRAILLPTATRDGYTFVGWNSAPDASGPTTWDAGAEFWPEDNVRLYAIWQPTAYDVTFAADGGTPASRTVSYLVGGDPVSEPAPPARDGYVFVGWFLDAENQVVFPYTPFDTTTLRAHWTPMTFTVTFDAHGGDAVTPASYTVGGDPVTLPTTVRAGFDFVGWYNAAVDGNAVADPFTTLTDVTLHAVWRVHVPVVTFDANGGSGSMATQQVDGTADLSLNAFIRQYYDFAGWNTVADGSGSAYADGQSVSLEGDLTLYAQWQTYSLTITADANGGWVDPGASGSISPWSCMSLQAATRTGYTFDGWWTAADGGSYVGTTDGSYCPSERSSTIYAHWTADVYTVSFDSTGGSSVGDELYTYDSGVGVAQPTAPTREGYTFAGWYLAEAPVDFPFVPDGNVTLTADWTPGTFTVAFDAQGGDAVASAPYTVEGTPVTLPTASRTGYSLKVWSTGADGSGQTYAAGDAFTTLVDITLYAQWRAHIPVVSFAANGGDGSMADQVADGPTALNANTFSMQYYDFTGWNTRADGGGTSYTDGQTVTLEGDTTLYAQWQLHWLSVTYDGTGGTVDPQAQGSVTPWSCVTLPTATRTGWTLDGWYTDPDTGSLAGVAGDCYWPSQDSTTLYAHWTGLTYTVRFLANGGTTVSGILFTSGDPAITSPATTRVGYTFVGWFVGAEQVSFPYTPTADVTMTAHWVRIV